MVHIDSFKVETLGDVVCIRDVNAQVLDIVKASGIQNGLVVVATHHTTCSVTLQEYSKDIDEASGNEFMQQDLVDCLEKIIPTMVRGNEDAYRHPGPWSKNWSEQNDEFYPFYNNTDGHIRSSLMGHSESLLLKQGVLQTGDYGHVYFMDWDQTRARTRTVDVLVMGE